MGLTRGLKQFMRVRSWGGPFIWADPWLQWIWNDWNWYGRLNWIWLGFLTLSWNYCWCSSSNKYIMKMPINKSFPYPRTVAFSLALWADLGFQWRRHSDLCFFFQLKLSIFHEFSLLGCGGTRIGKSYFVIGAGPGPILGKQVPLLLFFICLPSGRLPILKRCPASVLWLIYFPIITENTLLIFTRLVLQAWNVVQEVTIFLFLSGSLFNFPVQLIDSFRILIVWHSHHALVRLPSLPNFIHNVVE